MLFVFATILDLEGDIICGAKKRFRALNNKIETKRRKVCVHDLAVDIK